MKLSNSYIFKLLVMLCRLSILLILIFVLRYFFASVYPVFLYQISDYLLIAGVLIIAILNIFVPSFFSLTKDTNLLMFRFFSVSPFKIISFADYPKKQINIDKSTLAKYEINKQSLGLRKKLVLTIKNETGEATFPPIDISYISEKKLRKMLEN